MQNINIITIAKFFDACHDGELEVVKQYIQQGGDIHARTSNGNDGFSRAIYRGNLEVAEYLLDHGADINSVNNKGKTPLHRAIYRGNSGAIKFLIDKGADLNIQDQNGDTPLHYAAKYNYPIIAESLIEKGAAINIKNNDQKTALDLAQVSETSLTAEELFYYAWILVRDTFEENNFSVEGGKSVEQIIREEIVKQDHINKLNSDNIEQVHNEDNQKEGENEHDGTVDPSYKLDTNTQQEQELTIIDPDASLPEDGSSISPGGQSDQS